MTVREPRFTEQDRAELLALALYRDGLCPCGCGNPSRLTLAAEAEGPRWRVSETACQARLRLLETQRRLNENRDPGNASARLYGVTPVGR